MQIAEKIFIENSLKFKTTRSIAERKQKEQDRLQDLQRKEKERLRQVLLELEKQEKINRQNTERQHNEERTASNYENEISDLKRILLESERRKKKLTEDFAESQRNERESSTYRTREIESLKNKLIEVERQKKLAEEAAEHERRQRKNQGGLISKYEVFLLKPSRSVAYENLGLKSEDSVDSITNAYRRLANVYHPDKFAGLAEEFLMEASTKMKAINLAKEILSKRV